MSSKFIGEISMKLNKIFYDYNYINRPTVRSGHNLSLLNSFLIKAEIIFMSKKNIYGILHSRFTSGLRNISPFDINLLQLLHCLISKNNIIYYKSIIKAINNKMNEIILYRSTGS